MKIFLTIILVMLFMMNMQGYQPTRGEELVNQITAQTALAVKNEYSLQPCGSGATMPGGPIQKINLSFDSYCPYSKDELRKLLIRITEMIVKKVNQNEEIQEFLLKRPFDEKNVQVIIFNHNANGDSLFDPEICGAQISSEGLIYRTVDINKEFGYKNRYKETYDEALKLLSIQKDD